MTRKNHTSPQKRPRTTSNQEVSPHEKTQARPASPCEKCKRACNFAQCRGYRLWIDGCWNRYHGWLEKYKPQNRRDNVWRYHSPTIVQDYLREGPCRDCAARSHCPDDHFCQTYVRWQSQRWERLRHTLGYRPQ